MGLEKAWDDLKVTVQADLTTVQKQTNKKIWNSKLWEVKKFDFQTYHAIMFKTSCFQQVEQKSHKETGRYGAFKSVCVGGGKHRAQQDSPWRGPPANSTKQRH